MKVTSLHTYPIKSCRGMDHDAIAVEPLGLAGDRRWMIVDASNFFLTQREMSALAKLRVAPRDRGLELRFDDKTLWVDVPRGEERANVKVWNDLVFAAVADEAANQALSERLGRKVRLVFMDEKAVRPVDRDGLNGVNVSFADGFPILITTQASLAAVNQVIEENGDEPVSMERFRSNIVIDGLDPWEEDGWAAIQIGEVIFDLIKPCPRCVVTTQDQLSGERSDNNQPIRALTKLRRSGDRREKGVLFGWNLVPRNQATIEVGEPVQILETRPAWPIL